MEQILYNVVQKSLEILAAKTARKRKAMPDHIEQPTKEKARTYALSASEMA